MAGDARDSKRAGNLSDEALAPINSVGANELAGATGAIHHRDHVQHIKSVGEQQGICYVGKGKKHAVVNGRVA